MSHTSTIDSVVIADETIIAAAVKELQAQGIRCDLLTDAKPRAYYDDQKGMGKADMVISLPTAKYDVGVYKKADGVGYELRTDFYGGSVAKVLGVASNDPAESGQKQLGKFYQAYGIAATTKEALRKGYSLQRVNNADGSVQLRIAV